MTPEEVISDKSSGDMLYGIIYDFISANPDLTISQIVGVLEQIKCEQIFYGLMKAPDKEDEE